MKYLGRKLRYEKKYYIGYQDYMSIREKLKHVLKLDKFAGPDGDYFIRSIYFDDINDSALYEKNAGIFRRNKFRIRAYNMSSKTIKLENKRKFGEFISKESVKITKEEYYKIMNGDVDFMHRSDSTLKREFYFWTKGKALRPKVIVDYDREAYIGSYADIRITFDKQLRVSYGSNDIFQPDIVSRNIIIYPELIMEVKYNEFLPNHLRDILGLYSRNQCAASKYVYCRLEKNNLTKWG